MPERISLVPFAARRSMEGLRLTSTSEVEGLFRRGKNVAGKEQLGVDAVERVVLAGISHGERIDVERDALCAVELDYGNRKNAASGACVECVPRPRNDGVLQQFERDAGRGMMSRAKAHAGHDGNLIEGQVRCGA